MPPCQWATAPIFNRLNQGVTQVANQKKETKPVIAIVKWRESHDLAATEQVRSFDFSTHDARHGYLRFVTWALSRGYALTVTPGKITESR